MKDTVKAQIQGQDATTVEALKQLLEGTDDMSLAKGLAIGVIETLSDATHKISAHLWEGTINAQDLRAELDDIANCVIHDMRMFQEHTKNFETFCKRIREGDSD